MLQYHFLITRSKILLDSSRDLHVESYKLFCNWILFNILNKWSKCKKFLRNFFQSKPNRAYTGAARYVSTSGDANMWPLRLRIKKPWWGPRIMTPGGQSRFCSPPSVRNPAGGPVARWLSGRLGIRTPDTWRLPSERARDISAKLVAYCFPFRATTGWPGPVANGRRKGVRGGGRPWNRWSGGRARGRRRPAPAVRGLPPKGSSRWRAAVVPLRRPARRLGPPMGWCTVALSRARWARPCPGGEGLFPRVA